MNEQKFKPAWKGFFGHFFVIIACFAATLTISVKWLPARYQMWLWLIFAAVAACAACDMIYKRHSIQLIVKTDEIALELGLVGRQCIEISIRNIRTIKVNQSVIQRILNVGDIRVASSGTDEYEISAFNMPNPHEIKEAMQANERAVVKEGEHG